MYREWALTPAEKVGQPWATDPVGVQNVVWCTRIYVELQAAAASWALQHALPTLEVYMEDLLAEEDKTMLIISQYLGFTYTPPPVVGNVRVGRTGVDGSASDSACTRDHRAVSPALCRLQNWNELWEALRVAQLDHLVAKLN